MFSYTEQLESGYVQKNATIGSRTHSIILNVYQFSNHLSTASTDFLKPYVAQFQPTAFRARFVSNPNIQSLSEQTPDSCAAQIESAGYTQFSAEPAP